MILQRLVHHQSSQKNCNNLSYSLSSKESKKIDKCLSSCHIIFGARLRISQRAKKERDIRESMISAVKSGSQARPIEKNEAHTHTHTLAHRDSTIHPFIPHPRVAWTFSLRTFSMMCFDVSAYTTFYYMRDRRVAKSLIALFPDDGLIFISHLTWWFRSGQKLSASDPPLFKLVCRTLYWIFLSVCVRKLTRRDLHVVERVNKAHSCENLERDSII